MFIEKIEQLRQEPKAVRNRVAFGVALSVTLVIVAVWSVSLPARFTFEDAEPSQTGQNFTEQLAKMREHVGTELESIQSQAEALGSVISTSTPSTTESTVSSSAATLIELIEIQE